MTGDRLSSSVSGGADQWRGGHPPLGERHDDPGDPLGSGEGQGDRPSSIVTPRPPYTKGVESCIDGPQAD
jgi:hypothetical protein